MIYLTSLTLQPKRENISCFLLNALVQLLNCQPFHLKEKWISYDHENIFCDFMCVFVCLCAVLFLQLIETREKKSHRVPSDLSINTIVRSEQTCEWRPFQKAKDSLLQ